MAALIQPNTTIIAPASLSVHEWMTEWSYTVTPIGGNVSVGLSILDENDNYIASVTTPVTSSPTGSGGYIATTRPGRPYKIGITLYNCGGTGATIQVYGRYLNGNSITLINSSYYGYTTVYPTWTNKKDMQINNMNSTKHKSTLIRLQITAYTGFGTGYPSITIYAYNSNNTLLGLATGNAVGSFSSASFTTDYVGRIRLYGNDFSCGGASVTYRGYLTINGYEYLVIPSVTYTADHDVYQSLIYKKL